MPIQKRAKRKVYVRKRDKRTSHERLCDDLCNRLQEYDETAFDQVADLTGLVLAKGQYAYKLAEQLMFRTTCEVHTLQMNDPDNRTFRVHMHYEDRTKEPLHGYLYPRLSATFTSPSLRQAVIICYMRICRQAGRIIDANKGSKKRT